MPIRPGKFRGRSARVHGAMTATATALPATTAPLPPGPRNVLLSTLKYLRDPYRSLLEGERRYGDPFFWPSFLGPMVVTGHPEGIRTVFSADPDIYLAIGAELLAPVLGESNLILLSGERHRAMRKLQTPPFHGARMRAYGQIILDVAEEQMGRWPSDRPFDAHRTMQEISLQVILRAVLGLGEAEQRQTFKTAILELIAALKPSFMFMRALRRPFGGLGPWARFQRKIAQMTALLNEEVRARRADGQQREDIMSLLMAARYEDGSPLDDRELFEQVVSLIGAGHETTASSLAFALHHIHRHPSVKQRLVAELAALPAGPMDPETVTRLPYLGAVCNETLRLEPVAPLIGRTLRQELTLQGHQLPPGIAVAVGIINVHRRADVFADPDSFRPERFLERTFGPFEFLPFGGGARRCLGAAFATYEMKLVLATALRSRQLSLASEGPLRVVVRNTTVGPAGGVQMRFA
jgi:cytochrome P450 family 110